MTFMLGSFMSGLSQGARDIYGMADMGAQIDERRASTEARRLQTDMTRQAFDAGNAVAREGQHNAAIGALPVTPSDTGGSGTAGGVVSPGTTSGGPVAPTNFDHLPVPNNMQAVSPGYNPGTNPDAGIVPQGGPGALPTNTPGPAAAPTLAQGDTRAPTTTLGGAPAPAAPTAAPAPTPTNNYTWSAANGIHAMEPGETGLAWSSDQGLHRVGGTPAPAPAPGPTRPSYGEMARSAINTFTQPGTSPARERRDEAAQQAQAAPQAQAQAAPPPAPPPPSAVPVTPTAPIQQAAPAPAPAPARPSYGDMARSAADALTKPSTSPARDRRAKRDGAKTSSNNDNVGRRLAGALGIG